MPIYELLLPEFDTELQKTRKTLERLPEDRPDYRPHPKSMPLLKLANHTADMPAFLSLILDNDEVDLGKPLGWPAAPSSSAERLERFDVRAAKAREELVGATDFALHENFKLIAGSQTVFDGPRYHAVRALFFNHMIHHRAQLGVYLRLNDCPVPSTYGPSADESA